jgi:hypothetical protein
MGPGCGPIGSLQLVFREGLGREGIERRKWLTRVRRFPVWSRFFVPVSRE